MKNKNQTAKEKKGFSTEIENDADISDERWYEMCAAERILRRQLKKINVYEKTPEEVVQLMKDANLVNVLLEWQVIHVRNNEVQMKKGNGDILLIPTTQILLEAAKILQP